MASSSTGGSGADGWSSGLLGDLSNGPTAQPTNASLFSGMDSGKSAGGSNNSPFMKNKSAASPSMFGGMSINQSSPSPSLGSKGSMSSGSQQQSSGLGLAQPLIPVGAGGGGGSGTNSSGSGWSSSMAQGQQGDLLGGLMGSNSPMQARSSSSTGWSNNIGGGGGSAAAGSTQGPSSARGWSQSIEQKSVNTQQDPAVGRNPLSGMGTGQMNSNLNGGMNWSSNIQQKQQPLQPSGNDSMGQPIAAGYGVPSQQAMQPAAHGLQQPMQPSGQVNYGQPQHSGLAQPLIPQSGGMSGGWSQGLQQQQPNNMASGANPFANLSFQC